MTPRFADTQYFIALLNPADQYHDSARTVTSGFRGTLVTTEWVLAEVGNAMHDPRHRRHFVELSATLQAKDTVTVIPANSGHFQSGLRLYADRPDKVWSLIDCISFVVMEEGGLREALTADHHFEQAGFVALLK